MKKQKFRVLLLSALLPVCAGRADTLTETHPFGFEPSPGIQILTFARFDTMGGLYVLDSVELSGLGSISANVALENNSGTPRPSAAVTLTGGFTATPGFVIPPGPSAAGSVSYTSSPVSLGGSDGTAGSGPDFYNFGPLSVSTTDFSGTLAGPGDDHTPYTGTGTFDVNVEGMGSWSFSGLNSATLAVTNLAATGSLTLIYNYTVVPEPGVSLLAGFAALASMRRRRGAGF